MPHMLRRLQVSHFRVAEESINSIACLDGKAFVISACHDCNVYLHTFDGSHVGTFGVNKWCLDDPGSFQACAAHKALPLLDPAQQLFVNAEQARDSEGAICHHMAYYRDIAAV